MSFYYSCDGTTQHYSWSDDSYSQGSGETACPALRGKYCGAENCPSNKKKAPNMPHNEAHKEYVIIHASEDGDITVEFLTKDDLTERINPDKFGSYYYGSDAVWYEDIPEHRDPQYWFRSGLIIKGKIVSPSPKTVVTEYNVD
jgi:hypothetical protein